MRSRIQTRRISRIGARISSITQTFTRSGPAYQDGVEVPANTPRFPSNSGIVGVFIEEGATYLITQSSDLANAYWTKTGSSITAGVTAFQGVSLSRIVESAAAGLHLIVRGAVLTVGQPGTVFCYAKADTRTKMRLAIDASTQFASFDLAAGTVIGATGVTATIESKGGGVYLCAISAASVAVGNVYVYNMDAAGATSYTGDGVSGVLVGGVQAIQKAYPLSYYPTAGATATRNAETITVPTAGLLTPSSGSVIIKTYIDSALATGARSGYLLSTTDATGINGVNIRRSSTAIFAQSKDASNTTNATKTTALTVGWTVFGIKLSAAQLALWQDGASLATTAAPSIPAVLNANIGIGHYSGNGTGQWGAPIAYVITYNRTLSDAEMAAATAGNPPPDFTAYLRFTEGKLEALQGHPYQPAEVLSLFMDAR